jgi:hypothetical protein
MSLCNCRCTQLTSLNLSMHQLESYATMFTVGGLPEGIAALQRLQHLRLYNCVTAPLARGISQMTQLTSLKIQRGDVHDHDEVMIYETNAVAVRCSSRQAVQ